MYVHTKFVLYCTDCIIILLTVEFGKERNPTITLYPIIKYEFN